MRHARSWSCLLALLAAGCIGSGGLVPVTGKVTLEGAPLADATIEFIPVDKTLGAGASAVTRADGAYELKSREGTGVYPGPYKVIISKMVRKDGSVVPPGTPPIDADGKESIHPNYSDADKTTLQVNVSQNGGKLDFPLTKSGKPIR